MRLAVVGDSVLDIEVTGHAARLCPDAPVPVIEVERRLERAGGAGLIATLLVRDGHDVDLVTALADDDAARRLRGLLAGVRVSAGDLGGPTPVKMRVTADGQRVARIDEGCRVGTPPRIDERSLGPLATADAIVVADGGRRLADAPALRAALEAAARRVPVVWDPHAHGSRPIGRTAVVTPNLSELLAFSGRVVDGLNAVAAAAGRLRQRWGAGAVVVTLAERGALVCGADTDTHITPQCERLPVEGPHGAGVRFASALVLALAGGQQIESAVEAAVSESVAFLEAGGIASLEPRAGV